MSNPLKDMIAKQQAAKAAEPSAESNPVVKPGLSFLAKKPATPNTAIVPAAKPALPAVPEEFSLDSLADFDASDIETQRDPALAGQALLQGETPAQAPTRELPADLTEQQLDFVAALDSVYGVLFDAEVFGQVTKNIMQELQAHPEYMKLVADSDVNIMMKGMRESMGLARIKKQEKKPAAGRAKKVTAIKHQESLDALNELFGEGEDV